MSENAEADNILNAILSSKAVTEGQVSELQAQLNRDWVVDKDEIEMLFKANQAIGGNDEECPVWSDFFVNSVARLVVMDLDTPGEIDQEEGDWLGGLIEQYSVGNESEQKLYAEIKNTSTKISGKAAEHLKSEQ